MADRAIKKRGGHRAEVTKLRRRIEALLAEDVLRFEELQVLRGELCKQRDAIIKLDECVSDIIDVADIDNDIAEASVVSVHIAETLLMVDKRMLETNTKLASEVRRPEPHSKMVKLPTINLPFFDGSILMWQQFWDLYKTSIHDRTDVSDASKFHYLLSQLRGEASQLMVGFNHTSEEYQEAVKLLNDTYGNKRKLVEAHVHAILDLKPPMATSKDLSRYRAQYEGHIRGLKSLGANIDDAGYVYATVILRKLPKKIRENINREGRSDHWDLTSLRKALETEIGHMQATEHLEPDNFDCEDELKNSKLGTMSLPVSSGSHQRVCPLCDDSTHSVMNCVKFKTAQSRQQRARSLKLCFNCLRPRHQVRQCSNKFRCRTCQQKPHTALCNEDSPCQKTYKPKARQVSAQLRYGEEDSTQKRVNDVTATDPATALAGGVNRCSSMLPTALVTVSSGNSRCKVRLLLDSGSQKTFIKRDVVRMLRIPVVNNVRLTVNGFQSSLESTMYDVVKFDVQTERECIPVEAVVVDSILDYVSTPGRCDTVKKLKNLGISLADPTESSDKLSVEILVGIDQYFKFVPAKQVDEIAIIPSKLGNLIAGNIPNIDDGSTAVDPVTVLRVGASHDNLDTMLEKFWELDAIGITHEAKEVENVDEFKRYITFKDGQFVARLPWRNNHPKLPSNYALALGRMKSNVRTLNKQPESLQCYDSIIKDQLKNGFIERVLDPDISEGKVHYIAHHSVAKQSNTTPLRIVFDCSAKLSNDKPSLNDCLFSGPSLVNDLFSVLMKFRQHPWACVADIEKAYLMIQLDENDRDCTRFLWPSDPYDPCSKVDIFRFKVVFFGATCSQFLLNMSIKLHLENNADDISRELLNSLYIDNVAHSCPDENFLIEFYRKSKSSLRDAGFNLREWATNSAQLSAVISEDGKAVVSNKIDVEPKHVDVLGLKWDTTNDKMYFKVRTMNLIPCTKRSILKNSAQIFDPLGFLLPVTIKARLLMQDLWRMKVGWDEDLTLKIGDRWSALATDLNVSQKIQFSRTVMLEKNCDICAFCDSSAKAYGVVVYIRTDSGVHFVAARARVVPIKAPSLPQLELTAANLAARLVAKIIAQWQLDNSVSVNIWCDSKIVLHWILGNKLTNRKYVDQRVEEIRAIIPTAIWRYVPSSENPADIVTRGVSGDKFLKSREWVSGPAWLSDKESWIPFTTCDKASNLTITDHVITIPIPIANKDAVHISTAEVAEQNVFHFVSNFVNRFSSYARMIRVFALILRFIYRIKVNSRSTAVACGSSLTTQEITESESKLLELLQRHYYRDCFQYLEGKVDVKPPIVRQLNLGIEEGRLICRGRLRHAALQQTAKFPLLLPSKCHFTNLLISSYHFQCFHAGVNHVLSSIRDKYWIPSGRQRVKSILRTCIICKRYHARTIKRPVVAPYPHYRVVEANPFSTVGVDYTGAMYVKDKEHLSKVYVCLFTCMVTRAIHLELVEDASAEAFMFAFRRFTARRSCPSLILSDNAPIFVNSSTTLREICNNELVQNALCNLRIQWKFIPVKAPHFGGVWERLIGVTKFALKKVLGSSLLSYTGLNTIVCEVESFVNDRPLTHVSDSLDDDVLTPSHLLHGYRIRALGNSGVDLDTLLDPTMYEKEIFSKREQRLRLLLGHFYNRWKNEYLKSLREKDRHLLTTSKCHIAPGDIVLICDDAPRMSWPLGRVMRLHTGLDGIVRSVELKTKAGLTTRPVIKLVNLEIPSEIRTTDVSEKLSTLRDPTPKRDAAKQARSKIAKLFQ